MTQEIPPLNEKSGMVAKIISSVEPALPISARRFRQIVGITKITLWRWEKKGLIKTLLICGQKYIPAESLAEFTQRSENNELKGNFRNVCRKPSPRGKEKINQPIDIESEWHEPRLMKRKKRHCRAAYRRGCRCNVCIEANQAYQRDYMRKKRAAAASSGTRRAAVCELRHDRSGYVRGCRCNACIEANRTYQRDYMRKKHGHAARSVPHQKTIIPNVPGQQVEPVMPESKSAPAELVTLAELARIAFLPTETVRRRVLNGKLVPDFRTQRGIFFRRTRLDEVLSTLRRSL